MDPILAESLAKHLEVLRNFVTEEQSPYSFCLWYCGLVSSQLCKKADSTELV